MIHGIFSWLKIFTYLHALPVVEDTELTKAEADNMFHGISSGMLWYSFRPWLILSNMAINSVRSRGWPSVLSFEVRLALIKSVTLQMSFLTRFLAS